MLKLNFSFRFLIVLLTRDITSSQFTLELVIITVVIFFSEETCLKDCNDKWLYKELRPIKETLDRNYKIFDNLEETSHENNAMMKQNWKMHGLVKEISKTL